MRLRARSLLAGFLWILVSAVAADAQVQIISGQYVGNSVSNRSITGVGFQPDLVIIKGDNSEPAVLRSSTMSGSSVKELGTSAGFRTNVFRQFDPDGFSIRIDPSVNVPGVVYHWTAFRSATSGMVLGTYLGTGLLGASINTGFLPSYVMVWSDAALPAVQRFGAQTGDATLTFSGDGETPNRIVSFGSNGFDIGTDPAVDALATTFYYAAWPKTVGQAVAGSYAGDGTDDRSIGGAGLWPYAMFAASDQAGMGAAMSTAAIRADLTVPLDAGPLFSDGVQALEPDGFQVGAGARVNGPGTHYYVAFQNAIGTDLDLTTSADHTVANEGDTLVYSVRLSNLGPSVTNGVQVTETLPAGFQFLSSSASQGTFNSGNGLWIVGTVAGEATLRLDVTGVVTPVAAGTTLFQTATVTNSNAPDLDTTNESDSSYVTVPLIALDVSLSVNDVTPTVQERIQRRVRVWNSGPDSAHGVVLRILDGGMTESAPSADHGTYDPTGGQWTVGVLAAGDSAVLIDNLTPAAGTAGTRVPIVALSIAHDEGDQDPSNDADIDTIAVQKNQARVISGSYVGNGAVARAISGLGFQPDLVLIKGSSAVGSVLRTRPMSGDAAKDLGANAALAAGRIASLDRDGFTVGGDGSVNQTGSTYYWTAMMEATGELRVGTYTGVGVDNANYVGMGFQPQYLMVFGAGTQYPIQRYGGETGDASLYVLGGPEVTNRIQRLDADGFQLGSSTDVNVNGALYYFVALGTAVNRAAVASYAGTGADNRAMPILGLRPSLMFLTRKEGGYPTLGRTRTITTDLTLPLTASAGYSNGLQRFTRLGFELGSSSSVNSAIGNYYLAALRDPLGADVWVATSASKARPTEGDTLTLTLTVSNGGFEDATAISARDRVPTGLTYRAHAASQGSYDPVTGVWTLGGLANGASATLALTATVNAGTAGTTIRHAGYRVSSSPLDGFADDDGDSLAMTVATADLDVRLTVNDLTPAESETVGAMVRVRNAGPDSAHRVVLQLPPSVWTLGGNRPSRGTFDQATATWAVGDLGAGDSAVASLGATLAAGTANTILTVTAGVASRDEGDPNAANDVDTDTLAVQWNAARVISGTYAGNGAAARAIAGVGFQPDLLLIKSSSATAAVARTKWMTGTVAKDLANALAPAAGRVLSLDRDGFTVGADSSVNRSGLTYYWTAVLETPGQIQVGTYTGNGADNRAISGVGFQPHYLMVLGAGAQASIQRYGAETGDASLTFLGGPEVTNRIQRLDPDGFQLGTHGDVNGAGVTYHYVAFGSIATRGGVASYTGTGIDDRALASPGFRPDLMFVTRRDGGSVTVMRNRAVSGDLTLPMTWSNGYSNGLQRFPRSGVELGTAAAINAAGNVYLMAALRDSVGADVSLATSVSDATPSVGDTLTLTLAVTNLGFESATGIRVRDGLPAGLTYRSNTASQGSYDSGTGLWTVGNLANGASASLALSATVAAGTAGTVLRHAAYRTTSSPLDAFGDDDADSTGIDVQWADLDVELTVDDYTPVQSEILLGRVRVRNAGPDSAHAIVAQIPLGSWTYASNQPSRGTFDAATGLWTLGDLAVGDSATLAVGLSFAAGTAGTSFAPIARLVARHEADLVSANDADTQTVAVQINAARVISGSYVGDGAVSRGLAGVGFQPDLLLIKGTGATSAVARTKSMTGNAAKDLGAPLALAAGRILSLDRDGFTVGSDASVNQAGVTYYWSAVLETPGQVKVGSYAGNGADNRALATVGFRPNYLMLFGAGAQQAIQRYGAETGDASLGSLGGPEIADRIQSLDPSGFQLGANAEVNASGTTYHYVAFGDIASRGAGASYPGNGIDDRALASPGFRPGVIFLTRKEGGSPAVFRNRAVSGNLTLPLTAAAGYTNGLQRLTASGLELGSSSSVNAAGGTYYLAALRDSAGADMGLATSVSDPTPNSGDTLTLALTVSNHGYGSAAGMIARDRLPSGLTYRGNTATQGSYDPATGVWTIGALANGATATLSLSATVNAGTAGTVLHHAGYRVASTPADAFADDDADSSAIDVQLTDLALTLAVDDLTPIVAQPVAFTVRVDNVGADSATTVSVAEPLPAGLVFQSAVVSQGAYDPATARWTVGAIAPGGAATMTVTAAPTTASAGVTVIARVFHLDQVDPASSNDADTSSVTVLPPGFHVMAGSYVGDGSVSRAVTGIGFQPDLLVMKGSNTGSALARTRSMPANGTKELGASAPLVAGRVLSLDADGFTVGSDASVNQSGVTYYWCAFLESPGQMTVGSYLGNGADNRALTGFGFQPGYAMVLGGTSASSVQRYGAQSGDASLPFTIGAEFADRIQRLDPDGVQLGASAEVNASGVTYYYAAFRALAGRITTGTYAGDGVDGRSITAPGFRPDQMFLGRREGGTSTAHRNRAVPGDLTLPSIPVVPYPNGIQRLLPLGFEVGTSTPANAAGNNYYYALFRDSVGADVGVTAAVSDATPNEGDTLALTLTVSNHGFEGATGVLVSDRLPAGLTRLGSAVTAGSYNPASGTWSLGNLANGASATLTIDARVAAGTAGTTMTYPGYRIASLPADPFADDDGDSVAVRVLLADLEVVHTVDDFTPVEGEGVVFKARVDNHGPDPATGIVVMDLLPADLTLLSAVPSQGAYDASSGVWTVGTVTSGQSATLTVNVTPTAGIGATTSVVASLLHSDVADPVSANDVDSATVTIHRRGFRLVTGSYVGNGTSNRAVTGVGFQPDLLIVKGVNATAPVSRTKYMPSNTAKELGTLTAPVANRIVSLDADGFTLGSDASVNLTGVTYYWSAFLETPGQMKVGTYTGTGADNRALTGLGFQPGYAMVLGANSRQAVQRYAGEAGDGSLPFQSGAEVTDRIQRFDADGFQLGGNSDVNASGVTYHYAAWSSTYDRVQSGLYLGNGFDNRNVTGAGFKPKVVMIKRLDSGFGVQRSASIAGDYTLPMTGSAGLANVIQALVQDGFQLGTDASVNSASQIYFWLAFGDIAVLDLGLTMSVSDSTPNEGDAVTYTLRLENLGPENATGVVVTDNLPAGLTYRSHLPSIGAYDPATGVWTLGSVVNGDVATLAITASVDPGAGGTTVANDGSVAALDQTDSTDANNHAAAAIRVQSADLEVSMSVDRQSARESDSLTFTVSAVNLGPDAATGVTIRDQLPAGLTYLGHTAASGTYDSTSGLWSVGSVAAGDTTRLTLSAVLDMGTGGSTITDSASIVSADQADPVPSNRVDSISVYVALAPGVQITADQDSSAHHPGERRIRVLTLTLLNSSAEGRTLQRLVFTNRTQGPGARTQLDAELDTLTLHRDSGNGTFDPADPALLAVRAVGGTIAFDSLQVQVPSGSRVQLHLAMQLPLNARDGDLIDVSLDDPTQVSYDQQVTALNPWPVDPAGVTLVDGMARAQLAVLPFSGSTTIVGATRQLALDLVLPPNGYEPDVLNGIRLVNLGSARDAMDLTRVDLWGDGNNGVFDSGGADDFPLGTAVWDGAAWTLGGLSIPIPMQGRRVFASVDVSNGATAGRTVTLALGGLGRPGITMASGNNGPVDSTAVSPNSLTIVAGPSLITLSASQNSRTLLPGAAPLEVLRWQMVNHASQPETLRTLTLTNATSGPGTVAERDREWLSLDLTARGQHVGSATFQGGRATFSLNLSIAAGDSLVGIVESGASNAARDGDLLDLSIEGPADVALARPVQLGATWPVDPGGTYPVDGMSAAQVLIGTRVSPSVLTGSTRNLALEVVIPANGYSPDSLEFLLVRNTGNATPGTDITKLEAWADDGDGVYEPSLAPGADRALGEMSFTGGGWALGGFSQFIPATGLRVYFSCDLARDALEDHTIRLLIPSSPINGIGVTSANDGPRDVGVENPVTMTIGTVDRITWTTQNITPSTVAPGDTGVVLLHLVARNTYRDSSKTLTAMTVANLTSGSAIAQSDLDAEIQTVELRADGTSGPLLGRSFFSRGKTTFSGLSFVIASQQSRDLYVVAKISTSAATDGDVVRASVQNEGSLSFAETASMAARFPLTSGAAWTIDGMIARQITTFGTADTTLGPAEGPALALDWTVPRNGYADDVLESVKLTNLGSAGPADLAEMRLWRDGGNRRFDAGTGDDRDLGILQFANGKWSSAALSEPLSDLGARLFASIRSSADPQDSAIVRLSIPLLGIGVASGNDGPRDVSIQNVSRVLFSRSRLLATIETVPPQSVIGDTVVVKMTVRNTGDLGIYGILPSALALSGDATLAPDGTVSPPFLNLDPGVTGVFAWAFRSTGAGTVRATGSATGTELQTGFVHQSLPVTTLAHRVYELAQWVDLDAIESMPFSVNRGQVQVVPISLTFTHPGLVAVSDVLLQRLLVSVEDEFGNGIVPADLLSRVRLSEGANVYAQNSAPPASGSVVDLTLAQPLRISSGGGAASQVTLSLALDVSDTTRVPIFRLAIVDVAALQAVDATNGSAVTVRLGSGQAYPIQSGLARVVAGATRLDVAWVPDTARAVGQGQALVDVLSLTMDNPGPVALGPDVRLSDFDVTLVDSAGAPIARPLDVLKRVRVTDLGRVLLDRAITATDNSGIRIKLSPLLNVPINTPTVLRVTADLSDSATLGVFRMRVADPASFVAINASTGERLPALLAANPIDGPRLSVEARAESLRASRVPAVSGSVSIGAPDVKAMTLTLVHPGTAGTSPIVTQSLVIRCRDQFSRPVIPATLVDHAFVMWNGIDVGNISNAGSSSGEFTIPLHDVMLDPGQRAALDIHFGIVASAFAGLYELSVVADGIRSVDRNLGTPVMATADSGAEFPLSSGFIELIAPARELVAGFVDRMPAALVADGRAVPVGRMTLRNRAAVGEIQVDRLEWEAAQADLRSLPIGAVATRVEAWVADTLWAAADVVQDTVTVTLLSATPLVIAPGPAVEIEWRLVPRDGNRESFRVGCRREGIVVRQPASPLLRVSVTAEEAQDFPFWTEAGVLNARTLAESYSNYPNPFAAGRQNTQFVYYLRGEARVTLNIWTAVGEKVTTLLSGSARSAGLHQDDVWDGRNGAGHAVVNGVYLAELVAVYGDGKSERILRKVAVAR